MIVQCNISVGAQSCTVPNQTFCAPSHQGWSGATDFHLVFVVGDKATQGSRQSYLPLKSKSPNLLVCPKVRHLLPWFPSNDDTLGCADFLIVSFLA